MRAIVTGCVVLACTCAVLGQRPGGNILARPDDQGRVYFEVRSEHPRGNHGGPVPMRVANGVVQWPRTVTIAANSFWRVKPEGTPGADVTAAGNPLANDPRASELAAPDLPRWALIARWVSLAAADADDLFRDGELPTQKLTPWFMAGKAATFQVPIPSRVNPSRRAVGLLDRLFVAGDLAREEFQYDPLVALQYMCNEYRAEHRDNSGWLHVYQTWNW